VFTGDYRRPMLVIDPESVKELRVGNQVIANPEVEVQEPKLEIWSVTGSKGNKYSVTKSGNFWTCDCVAFQMKRICRHIKETKEKIKE
jgi:frataxin-like iron-binding protein CyaY